MFFENREEFDKIYSLMKNDFEMFLITVPINYPEYTFGEFLKAYFDGIDTGVVEEKFIIRYLKNTIINYNWSQVLKDKECQRWDENDLDSTMKMYLKHFPDRQKATVKISWDDYKNEIKEIKIHCISPFNYIINLQELTSEKVKVICDYLSENDFVDVNAKIDDVVDLLEASFNGFANENYVSKSEKMHFRAETTIQDFYDLTKNKGFHKFFKNLKP